MGYWSTIDGSWQRRPLRVEEQAIFYHYITRRSIGTIHSHSGAAPLIDCDPCGTRTFREQSQTQPGPRSGQSLNGIILVNSTSGRMDQERFIAINELVAFLSM
jgi:hypothetical protein